MTTGRPRVPEYQPNEKEHRRQIARALNEAIAGRLDCTLLATLEANEDTTTVTDARVNLGSMVLPTPLTVHAAAEIGAGGLWFEPANGSVVIHHANNAQTDRTFRLAFIG